MSSDQTAMIEKLIALYGQDRGTQTYAQLQQRLHAFRAQYPELNAAPFDPVNRVTEQDAILIAYGGTLYEPETPPLQSLHKFLRNHLRDTISTVHILPFFPYSSDDGFSVIDYQRVDPALGTWSDIQALGQDFTLMFDGVINHISAHSQWFKSFVAGDPDYQDFFIAVDPDEDLSQVVRPRALPLLTRVETARGVKHVWTTFSADQIDLNYACEDTFLRIVDVLLFYVSQGMRFLRLDAIAYLWKEIGTPCIHLEQTHIFVRLVRDILDVVAPHVGIITETNVPHAENIAYFYDGRHEAQMVYQFTLPPLTLHAFATGNASQLTTWAASLSPISDQATFFNFTASHDGIGLRPVEGILNPSEVQALAERAQRHGGRVSYKANSDGTQSPYELNITYFDALSNPEANESPALQAQRFIASQAIALSLMGVPGIYIHSLLGSRNWVDGVAQTGQARSINREQLRLDDIEQVLLDPMSLRSHVFFAYMELLRCRRQAKAFHPNGPQQVIDLHPALFTVLRTSPDATESVLALHNVSNDPVAIDLTHVPVHNQMNSPTVYHDLISGHSFNTNSRIALEPYQVMWLKNTHNE